MIANKEFGTITLSSDCLRPENIQVPLTSLDESCWYPWELILKTKYEATHTVANVRKCLGTTK